MGSLGVLEWNDAVYCIFHLCINCVRLRERLIVKGFDPCLARETLDLDSEIRIWLSLVQMADEGQTNADT